MADLFESSELPARRIFKPLSNNDYFARVTKLPVGLNIPAGAKLQVDDGKAVDLPVQTCEARGCYAGAAVAPELLAAMKAGKQLKVSFQNLNKETLTVPLPLADFAAAYEKIK